MNTDSFPAEGLAIVALTKKGVELGRLLKTLLAGSRLYSPDKFVIQEPNEESFCLPARTLVRKIFNQYKFLVLIMAVGAAVRLIASSIRDKNQDPGVTVIDDSGRFAVSLLSGHIGGANELTGIVASLVGAQPVVSTASDDAGLLSLDLLAKSFGWETEDTLALRRVSSALVNEEPVGFYQDAGERDYSPEELSAAVRAFPSLETLAQSRYRAAVIITDKLVDMARLPATSVVIRPKNLVLGVGCNRGVGCSGIEKAVAQVFSEYGLSPKCIRNLATIDAKRDEGGLLEFAEKNGLPVQYLNRESLKRVEVPSRSSPVVLRYVGVPAVCEAAALLSSGGRLVVPKVRFNREITLAVARLSYANTKKRSKLFLVGTGPGDLEHMTVKARQVIARSEAVVGYRTYIDLIRPLLSGKEVVATAMGQEVERVKRAVELAAQGKTVSLISGGDPGVYGMAGLVSEVLRQYDRSFDVEVIPGVPAMVAAGALLGAPLTGDVATVSLSDYLVTWDKIVHRLNMAAQGDFVIVLYNPRSKTRRAQLEEAREVLLQYRPAGTPVGIVTNAYRAGQSVILSDLGRMLENDIDMNTTVVIGNSSTLVSGGRMVTSRGYQNKYRLQEEGAGVK